MLGAFASRISGSADIFADSGKGPERSVNFVTCHDGFTLNDLVSYRYKHNEANGEGNRDGSNENFSENYGFEGETHDIEIERTRKRQIGNFLLTALISRGVPMLLGGDEFRRTQRGNNNAYCQDNETSWYDWSCVELHRDIYRFTRGMTAFRCAHPVLSEERFYTDADVRWFDPELRVPNWADRGAKRLGCLIHEGDGGGLYLMFNAGIEAAPFRVPPAPDHVQWRIAVDTGRETPQDLFLPGEEPVFDSAEPYPMTPRSGAILLWRKDRVSHGLS
jgi:glycogen operon protein